MSNIFGGDASEVYRLAGDLTAVGARMVGPMRTVMGELGDTLAEDWRSNADEHFRPKGHAQSYSKSIDADLVPGATAIEVEAGPNSDNSNQAFLGRVLEFGGEHSPAYLDGLRALDGIQARGEKVIDAAVTHLMP